MVVACGAQAKPSESTIRRTLIRGRVHALLGESGFLGPLLDTFNYAGAEIVVDWCNAPNLESSGSVQVAPLIFSSFLTRNKDQHVNVQELRRCTSDVPHRWKD